MEVRILSSRKLREVAQLVEHGTENLGVNGSTPFFTAKPVSKKQLLLFTLKPDVLAVRLLNL